MSLRNWFEAGRAIEQAIELIRSQLDVLTLEACLDRVLDQDQRLPVWTPPRPARIFMENAPAFNPEIVLGEHRSNGVHAPIVRMRNSSNSRQFLVSF
jgi:hypothetical protein